MVGLIQSFSAPQTRPIQRLFELGSRYPYSVAGKFMGTITLTSIMFDAGSNLLGGIYEEAFMPKATNGQPEIDNMTQSGVDVLNRPQLFEDGLPIPNGGYSMADVGGAAGGIKKDWGAIRMSLDDNRLDVPFGLVLTLFQSAKRIRATSQASEFNGAVQGTNQDDFTFRAMACLFFEMVKLEDYSFDLNANQELITEYARFFYTGLVNVKTTLQSTNVASNRTATEG
jgi:hypothetical protein